jgi:Aspartyl/Asparaginyl beta-hydroxylase
MFFLDTHKFIQKVPDELFVQATEWVSILDFNTQKEATKAHKAFAGARITELVVDSVKINRGLEAIISWVEQVAKNPCFKATLSWIPPHGSCGEHTDNRHYHSICSRYHIPLKTAGSRMFSRWHPTSEIIEYVFRPGNLYLINNKIPHLVVNDYSYPRVHLIVDVCPLQQITEYIEKPKLVSSFVYPTPFELSYFPEE